MNIITNKYFLTVSLLSLALASGTFASNQDKDMQQRSAAKTKSILAEKSPALTLEVLTTMKVGDARLEQAAKKGNLDAINRLGYCYMHGEGCKPDGKMAQSLFQKGADQGHPRSLSNLAYCLENGVAGKVTLKTINQAIDLYRQSAKLGNPVAMSRLGDLLKKEICGRIVTAKDMEEAFSWYKQSAESGDREGMYNYGYCLKDAVGCEDSPQNKEEAVTWFIKSMTEGKIEAFGALGDVYIHGIGCPKNVEVGLFWYEKGAEKGFTLCMNNLATAYFDGVLCPKNPKGAEEWFLKALALENSPTTHANLGALYFLDRNYDKALYHLKNGLERFSTHTLIGFIYLQKKDYASALHHYELAQEAGEKVKQAPIDYLRKKIRQLEAVKRSQGKRVNVIKAEAIKDQQARIVSGNSKNAELYKKLAAQLEAIKNNPELSKAFDAEKELKLLTMLYNRALEGLEKLEPNTRLEKIKNIRVILGNVEEKIFVFEQQIESEKRLKALREAAKARKLDKVELESAKETSSQLKKEAKEAAAKKLDDEKQKKHEHHTRKHEKPTTKKAKEAKRKPSPETVKVEVVKGPFAEMKEPVKKTKATLDGPIWKNVYKICDTLKLAKSMDDAKALLGALEGDFDFKEVSPAYAGCPNAKFAFEMRVNIQYRVIIAFEEVIEQVYEPGPNGENNNNPVQRVTYKLYGNTIYIDDPHKG